MKSIFGNNWGMFESKDLEAFFLIHLNNLYCTKSHIAERLAELTDISNFKNLASELKKLIDDTIAQTEKTEIIYDSINANSSLDHCEHLIGIFEDAFDHIQMFGGTEQFLDFGLIMYLKQVADIESSSYHILQAICLKYSFMSLAELLAENCRPIITQSALFTRLNKNIF